MITTTHHTLHTTLLHLLFFNALTSYVECTSEYLFLDKRESSREITEEEGKRLAATKRLYSRDELKDKKVNTKAMKLMGDVMLSSDKALRILGKSESFKSEKDIRTKILLSWRPRIKLKLKDKIHKTRYNNFISA